MYSLMVFVVCRGVLDQDNGAVEIPLHPRSHDHEVPPQVSHPEKLGLEGENRAGLVFSKLRLIKIISRAMLSVSFPRVFST